MKKISCIRILSFMLAFSLVFQSFTPAAAASPEGADFPVLAEKQQDVTTMEEGEISQSPEPEEDDGESLESPEQEGDRDSIESSESEATPDEIPMEEEAQDEPTQEPSEEEGVEPVDEAVSPDDTPQGIMPLGDTYRFETVDEIALLKKWLEVYHTSGTEIVWDDSTNTLTSMPIDSAEQLVLLSHTAPSVYCNATFKSGKTQGQVSVSGKFPFSEKTLHGELLAELGELTFLGLGSDETPFKGCFEQADFSITTDRVLFNALDCSTATFGDNALTINRVGTNNTDVMVATRFITSGEQSLKVTLQTNQEKFFSAPFGTIEFSNNNDDKLDLEVSFAGNKPFENFGSTNNAGMVANTVTGGTLGVKISTFPSSISIAINNNNVEANNAGLLVGRLNNASLELNGEIVLPDTAKVQSVQGAAGGLAGRIDNKDRCSVITVTGNVNLTNATILGKYSGGVAGYANSARFAFDKSNPTVTLPKKLGETANSLLDASMFVHSTYTGGIFGWYEQNHVDAYAAYNGQGFDYPEINLYANTDTGEVGALFGRLQLGTGCNFTVSGTDNADRLGIACTVNVKDSKISAAGCLVGGLEGNGRANQLTVTNTNPVVTNVTTDKVNYLGGVVGSVKNATLSVENITATAKTLTNVGYFGGVVGNVDQEGMLKTAGTVKILTKNESDQYVSIAKGGGLVGQVGERGVVCLRGTTDLSDVRYGTADNIGQLVGNQGNSLVFAYGDGKTATTWQYMRSTDEKRVDDIGNYGQVIRLGNRLSNDLITINNDNTIEFKAPRIGNNTITDDFTLTIASADDFALLAIAFMTNNSFGLYGNTPISTLNKIDTYKLTDNIDLSGTGIQGLMRDQASDTRIIEGFKNSKKRGIFDGDEKTLQFNVGEPYGLRGGVIVDNTQPGSGQCYRHGRYGLIGNANSVIVQNLSLGGTMNIGADQNSVAGFVIGCISGGNRNDSVENLIDNVTLLEGSKIIVDGSSDTAVAVGGFVGSVAGGEETDLAVKNSKMNAAILYTGTSNGISMGGILGKAMYKTSFQCTMDSVEVAGKIASESKQNARVGGLIADIGPLSNAVRDSGTATVSLKNVKIASEIEASAATTSCGGLLGYYWDNVDVAFEGNEQEYAVETTGSSLTANNLKMESSYDGRGMGGLCFAATGKWEMQGKAVNLENTTIQCGAGPLGLLVCHGERQGATVGTYVSADGKALYLEMNTEWGTAYKLNKGDGFITGTPAVFDEIVAFTAANGDITQNDAGVISLHTANGTVNMTTGDSRNTYENRTAYGRAENKVNPYSRYYYNLDTVKKQVSAGDVATPQALLLWSVRKYCAANIRDKYLDVLLTNTITETLNMDGYSYYPVTVCNESVKVTGATITFHNHEIETKETGNKSTRAAGSTDRTQHFAMHSGLLYNYYTDQELGEKVSLMLNDSTILGTIGEVGDGSGALICGKIYGYSGALPVRLNLNGLYLDSGSNENNTTYLSVADFSDATTYAPLLINNVGSFAVLTIAGVKAHDTTAGATSLIGNVGDKGDRNTQGINISFERLQLPDKQGRFTKATLINRLYYINAINSVVYNFTEDEEWTDGHYTHTATYGQEIGGTEEYKNSASNPNQLCYAQSNRKIAYQNEQGEMVGGTVGAFADFLPYVADRYDLDKGYHEIMVNSSLTDIVDGCGTYGDPYRLKSVEELMSVVSYLKNETSASKNWTLNIPIAEDGNSKFCTDTDKTHKTYQYEGETGKEWKLKNENGTVSNDDTLTNETVYTYLQNAYYMITNEVDKAELTNFAGFGTREKPFRGVIIGEGKGVTLTLKGTLPQGFIQCSYGSVVKNLTLNVEGSSTISFVGIKDGSGYTVGSYYGGVIGCVLGGDNIIENVSVTYSGTPVTLTETVDNEKKDHLIPVGGYVGVISGGGVIFRGNNTLTNVPCEKVNDANYFYANPYVGRVVQGFAVQEGATESAKLNNSIEVMVEEQAQQLDKNYQICQLDKDIVNGIQLNGTEITLKDAQALLVFTSVTNSGGAGGGGLLPYHTSACSYWNGSTFSAASVGGKVRNASYTHIGNTTADDEDYNLSLKDDFMAFGEENVSYLDTHYAQGNLYNVCHDTQAYSMKLSGDIYDMTPYGNGYRSIGARYLSNAVCDNTENTTKVEERRNYKLLNPLVSGFDGGGATLKTAITSKEYVDDENHAIAVGGVFNTIRLTKSSTTLKNVTIGNDDKTTSTIYHEYWECLGTKWNDSTHKNWNNDAATTAYAGFKNLTYNHGRGLIAAGGFAGNTSMENTNKSVTLTFKSINMKNLHIKSPFDAGGILGHTGFQVPDKSQYKIDTPQYSICCLINGGGNDIVPTFYNCTFDNLTVDGGWMVGGYLGIATQNAPAPLTGKLSKTGEIKISFDTNGLLGNNSSIVSRRKKTDAGIDTDRVAGGTGVQKCLPAAGGLIGCSSYKITIENTGRAKMNNVQVLSSRSTGGVIGWPFNAVTIKNLDVIRDNDKKTQIGDLRLYKEGGTEPCCEFAGGMIGYFESDGVLTVTDCTVENLLVVASYRSPSGSNSTYPCYAAGIVGNINANKTHTIANCKAKKLFLANDNMSVANMANSYEGGMVGRLQIGELYGANLLIDDIQFSVLKEKETTDSLGILVGASDNKLLYLAGVSIQHPKVLQATDAGENVPTPCTRKILPVGGKIPSKFYVAYADYHGTAQVENSENTQNTQNTQGKDVFSDNKYCAAPYVTTSPKGAAIPVGEQKTTMYLYGDGANPVTVNRIYSERNQTDGEGFYYSNAKDCLFESKYSSTFWDEMGLTEETAGNIPNFPVLQVPVASEGTVTKQIKDYINLVTNNGYATATSIDFGGDSHVSRELTLYQWNDAGYFEDDSDHTQYALNYEGVKNRDTYMTSRTEYDSGKNQFELLTVTFTEKGYKYTVQIPIVVRRMLEIDFMATIKDSPNFQKENYEVPAGLKYNPKSPLDYGSSVSALLTYTYNSAMGSNQDFNWEFHLNNGGFMGDTGQTIHFIRTGGLNNLPEGTQLILLDCADNNKAYSYPVGAGGTTEVKLSDFKDGGNNNYSRWLSEIMGVTATEDSEGAWVETKNQSSATARIQNVYYRPYEESSDGTSVKRYTLSIPDANKTISEQFYLVIYIPLNENTAAQNLNGYIDTSFSILSEKLACHINPVRKEKDTANGTIWIVADPRIDSDCTFNFLSSYRQELSDESLDKGKDPSYLVLLDNPGPDGNFLLQMRLIDKISVNKDQTFDDSVNLYFKEVVSLSSYKFVDGTPSFEYSNGFPNGCHGTVEFYVYTESGEKKYYTLEGSEWKEAGGEAVAVSYPWASDGKNMELYLATENAAENAISLAGIRKEAKGTFYVETRLNIHMSVEAARLVIAGAPDKGDAYTSLNYLTYLASGRGEEFNSTNYVSSKQGEVKYYQSRSGSSTITHSANDPAQLGINCSDLASADGVIYTTGLYDLTTVSNVQDLLGDEGNTGKAKYVQYTLTLWQRQENGDYGQVTDNLANYITSVRMNGDPVELDGSSWKWSDTCTANVFDTMDKQNSKRFILPIRVQVNTDVETNNITFANYQIRLTAKLMDAENETLDTPENSVPGNDETRDYDYVTYTITRILTDGYWGQQAETTEQVS